ncbi:MAG: DoxX family protein [Solirubrobacteraceae bacterium]
MSPRTRGGPATRGSEILPLFRAADRIIYRDRTASRVAVIAGAVFILAGLVKFVFHSWELHAFRTFGLPWPSALEILAGLVETAGGALLALRLFVVPVALVLGTTMIVAIWTSGVGHGDVIPSLTLAPALLAAMAFLVARAGRARSTLGG